jgi:hypothetical protein
MPSCFQLFHRAADLNLVLTDHDEQPTPLNSRRILPGDPSGRGSIVLYNQAAMFVGPETGYDTLGEARQHYKPGTRNFAEDIRSAFTTKGIHVPMGAGFK